MVDIHSHLLPGVDDGSPAVDVSTEVLRRFAGEGVERLVCTPHLNASDVQRAPHDRYAEIFERLREAAPATPRLSLGYEIMLDVPGADLTDPRLALGRSTAVLVEFGRTGVPARAAEELFRLRMSGVVPVLAHPERYWGVTLEQIREWKRVGAVIQTDTHMLLGSGAQAALARTMLEEGLVDCIASDNHGDTRTLRAARDWLVEQGAGEQAHMLTSVNAGRLLDNEPVLPVQPLPPLAKGIVARLRELVFGRA